MRVVSTRVFPEPAPARTSIGPSKCSTASRWAVFSPARGSVSTCRFMIQNYVKRRATRAGLQQQPTIMSFGDDAPGEGQPDSPPLLLGGKSSVEDSLPQLARNARSVVLHSDPDSSFRQFLYR